MKYLYFPNGDRFPQIGLGTFQSKKNEVYDAVITALTAGYRHIDCAYVYGNEKQIGEALKYAFANNIVRRDELFITSKLWNSFHAPEMVEQAIRHSLNDLQLDYLDLYLMHWAIAFRTGCDYANSPADLVPLPEMPYQTTWAAMEKLREKGLTKHIGVSNFSIKKLTNLQQSATIAPEVNQIEIHPYFQQNKLSDFCNDNNILLTAYSPLGSRHLINSDNDIQHNATIAQIAEKHACSATQVILAWGITRGWAVIPKSIHQERIIENFAAVDVLLDDEDINAISLIDKNLRQSVASYAIMPGGYYTYNNIFDEES
ncbi:MAG: aldo/keto reductase [Paludibacter sp.]|jgi:alcohol dehydrogenase (NADP+)|nr:aldo/keto reductase [Paludibacter sp.]